MTPRFPDLPILAALPALAAALAAHRCAVLEAPPGAGKSTVVPLALLDGPWRGDRCVLVLEPRRIAARAVAQRMADTLGEPLGETVGYRTRMDSRVGPRTRVEVVTEGILTRRLQRDPALEDTACVVFDEFHERSLQADLGLALCLDSQRHLREDLRVLVMSATLDGAALARLLGDAPRVSAHGRPFAVETRYAPSPSESRTRFDALAQRAAAVTLRALAEHAGDALVFLPGAADIRRVVELLGDAGGAASPVGPLEVLPLYGELAVDAQDRALRPAGAGRRKVVAATNIAETSLTIEGVRIVVDAGLERRPRFDPTSGMDRLETLRISQASADQRRGRAGRTAPGVCYRLWSESAQASLLPQTPPEIQEADLAPLALELACWGCADPSDLAWLDPPPAAALAQARELLARLEALDGQGRVTATGRRMAALPVHPRLAHMLLRAVPLGLGRLACELAALLAERDPLRADDPRHRDADLRHRVTVLRGEPAPPGCVADGPALARVRRVARRLERQLAGDAPERREHTGREPHDVDATGLLLAFAYPDRIGRTRASGSGRYLLSGGRGAAFTGPTALAGHEFIAVAALDAGGREAAIQLAAPLARADLERHFAADIVDHESVDWDPREEAVVARRERRLGELPIEERAWRSADAAALRVAMLQGIRALGLETLPWTRTLAQWRARVAFLRGLGLPPGVAWPDLSDAALLASLDDWLGPWLEGVTRREHLAHVPLGEALHARLTWEERRQLDRLAPTQLEVPSGSRIAVDYSSGTPTLSVRLQEVFGLVESPRVADGRVAVTLELLSPAQRPVQVTRDLASFWARGYAEVRKDLRGRYPKHYWPDDPRSATATRRVRPPGA